MHRWSQHKNLVITQNNSKFTNLMIKAENQSDLKKKKKLPTSNSETSNLCKPTTTTKKKKKQPPQEEPYLLP
jgi:hypothetical protein